MTTTRDTIDRAIGAIVCNASNFPEKAQSRILGQNMAPLRGRLTSAVMDALSAAPADDVREALAKALFRSEHDKSSAGWIDAVWPALANRHEYFDTADVILSDPHIEVHPRGTVTDAEHREAVHRAVRTGIESVIRGTADRDLVRAVAAHVLALEAGS